MDKFSMWTGLAHTSLLKHHPKFRRGQVYECLAAWLGHRTYASLRVHDLAVLNSGIKHAVFDTSAAIERAESLGFKVTPEQWRDVEWALKPSGVSRMWLTDMFSMRLAARIVFENSFHADSDEIARSVGTSDERSVVEVIPHTQEDSVPDKLRFTVHGLVRAFNDEASVATPVTAEVTFQRVGKRLYEDGVVETVKRSGNPFPYEPEFEGEDYSGGSYSG